MKKIFLTLSIVLLLSATPTMAQMMGYGQHMYQQQQAPPQQQYNPNQGHPGMMGGYGGYGMGPGMMGNYGYGMGPGMMGGYGGYGMGPGMMGGYGMGPGMMGDYGGYGTCPNCGAYQGQQFRSKEDYSKFLDDTKEQRKKLHDMVFEYNEEMRSPDPDREKLSKMGKEIYELRKEIFNNKSK